MHIHSNNALPQYIRIQLLVENNENQFQHCTDITSSAKMLMWIHVKSQSHALGDTPGSLGVLKGVRQTP